MFHPFHIMQNFNTIHNASRITEMQDWASLCLQIPSDISGKYSSMSAQPPQVFVGAMHVRQDEKNPLKVFTIHMPFSNKQKYSVT